MKLASVALDRAIAGVLPAGAALYAVGGRVRDAYRVADGEPRAAPKDLDYVVTGLPLALLVAALEPLGSVDVVGAAFAVVKLNTPDGQADIALPRRERSTGTAHRDFVVESGPDVPIEDDLRRRDFRMNMLARRLPDGELLDPYGGVPDIAARRIDIVDDRTFEEDPLRMLRAAQFAARFEFSLSARARAAMIAAAPLLPTVSAERIGEEIAKLMTARQPSLGLEILRDTGVLAHLWPELLEGLDMEQNEWHRYDVYRHNLITMDAVPPGDVTLRLAGLLHDVGKSRTKDGPHFYRHEHVGADLVPAMLGRLRASNEVVAAVEHLVRHHMYQADPDFSAAALRRFVRRVGPEHLERLFALRRADIVGSGLPKRGDSNERFEERVMAVVAERPAFSVRDLALSGAEVIALMVRAGVAPPGFRGDERVGRTLNALFEEVTDDPALNVPDLLAERAARYIAGHRRE